MVKLTEEFDNKMTCTNEVLEDASESCEVYGEVSEFFRRPWQEKFDR